MRTKIQYTTEQFHYAKELKCFIAEISELRNKMVPKALNLLNKKTGKSRDFFFYKKDMTDSGIDIGGWRYKTIGGDLEMLIIND